MNDREIVIVENPEGAPAYMFDADGIFVQDFYHTSVQEAIDVWGEDVDNSVLMEKEL